jgi:hypothetical protein
MRVQINPDPLRIVKRKALATDNELAEAVRCQAMTKRGYRCTRTQAWGSVYCRQHSRPLTH